MFAMKGDQDGTWRCPLCLGVLQLNPLNLPMPCAACKKSFASPRPAMPGGPGTELKKLLAKIGIVATPTCRCNSRAAVMDENERKTPGWCEENIDTIVGWLREEAANRGLPFLDAAGRVLVRRAIRNAKNIS